MSENLTAKSFRALNWSYLSTAVNAVMQTGFTAVLARLLNPEAYGLIAMAGLVLSFGSYFAQMGIGTALIQKEDLTTADIRAAFTSSALLGITFSALAFVLAPLALYMFDQPAVVPVVQVLGFSFFLTALSTTSTSLLRRRLDFRSLAVVEIVSYILGYGFVGVLLALMAFGVWSLVLANLSQTAMTAVLAYCCHRHSVLPSFNWKTHKKLLSFGGRVSIIGFLEFVGFNVDTFVIARFWGAQWLGLYSRSLAIINLPMQFFAVTFSKVLFSSFSQVQKEIPRLRSAYYSGSMLIAVVVMPVGFGTVIAAEEIIVTLLGNQWTSGITILQILALMVPFAMGTVLPAIVCESLARLKDKLLLQIAFVVLVTALVILAYPLGVEAVACAVLVGNILRFLAYQFLMRRLIALPFRLILNAHIPALKTSVGVIVAIMATRWLVLPDMVPGVVLAFEILAGGIAFLLFGVLMPQRLLKEVILQTLPRLRVGRHPKRVSERVLNWYTSRILLSRFEGFTAYKK